MRANINPVVDEDWNALMFQRVKHTLWKVFGIDRAIAYVIVGRSISILAGPITALMVISFLSPVEQGFYYTFNSLLAIQVFFELGLTLVVLQFASHEKANLEWNDSGTLTGDLNAKARLAALLRFSLHWYGIIAILFVGVAIPMGFIFCGNLSQNDHFVAWQLPWVYLVVVSGVMLFLSPLFALLEGCGLVAEVAMIRSFQDLFANVVLWAALFFKLGLMAAPLFLTIRLLWAVGWLVARYKNHLVDLFFFHQDSVSFSWRAEIWPFQWRIALSWLSGYFIFQLFTPVLFAFYGPTIAGQMGISIAIANAIANMALAWVNTKAAPFGSLIAKSEFEKLDKLFFHSLFQSIFVVLVGMLAFFGIVIYLNFISHPFAQRLLAPLPLGVLVLAVIVNQIVGAEAVYLRAHKQEPFLIISLIGGILVGLSTYFLGQAYAATGMVVGFFVVNCVVGLGGGTWVFIRKRRSWHAKPHEVAILIETI